MKAKYLLSPLIIGLILFASELRGQVKEYFITCDPVDFAYIYEHFEEDIYIPITIAHEGTTWTNVKMRIRGDGSRYLPKKSLKVKFYGTPFSNGRNELNFNAEYEDKSYIRATLSSMIFNMSGQKCFTTEHARLYLNGEFLGLYNRTENMDEFFLEAHGLDPDGNLYKASKDGACLNIYDDVVNFWEQKTGSGNKEDLIQLIAGLDQVSVEDFPQFIQQTMDYNQAVNIIACNMVTCNQSTYYHNYYMYRDANGNGRWEMMPWDLDKTLSVYSWRNHTYSSAPWVPDNPFLEKAILNEAMMADIKARANQIFDEIFTTAAFWPMIDSLVTVLEASVAQDTTDNIQSVQEWLNQVQVEKNYILNFPWMLNWYFDNVQSSFTCVATPGVHQPDMTFNWTESVDPNGLPITYRFLLTTGSQFQPGVTEVYDGLQGTSLTIENIPEGDYFWKVISIGAGQQEVEAFDSKNPLKIKSFEVLPCEITSDMTLTAANSPYLVNCNVTVSQQATLTINEGVKVLFETGTHIKVRGGFTINGTKKNPVHIKPADPQGTFDSIAFVQPQKNIVINHMIMTDGVIHAHTANVTLSNSEMILLNKNLVYQNVIYGQYYGHGVFFNNRVIGNGTGQGLEYGWCQSVIIENSYFTDIDDPMEFISVYSGYVKNNYAQNSNDDGIDFNNCKNMVIEGNIIYNCSDNGITIGNENNGPSENIIIRNNLIVNCAIGITVKDGSSAVSDRNTLYNNHKGFKLFELNAGYGGGTIDIVNTIISGTTGQVFDADPLSSYSITYSLCDTDMILGNGNIFADPMFGSSADTNFQLQPGSPCIDAGDPATASDPDGTIADMGAFFFNQGDFFVIFNEINYKSASSFDTGDWVELYNVDTIPANISGWMFKDEKDDHVFSIPFGTVLQPGGYLVLCENSVAFSQRHPGVDNFFGDFNFGLSSNGELIRLFNQAGTLIDHVLYGTSSPWPTEPNGQGATLELKSPWLDKSLPDSWCASSNYGTPGAVNSCNVFTVIEKPGLPLQISVFPNPTTGATYVRLNVNTGGELTIRGFDSGGKQIFINEIAVKGTTEIFDQLPHITGKGIFLVLFTFFDGEQSYSESVKLVVY